MTCVPEPPAGLVELPLGQSEPEYGSGLFHKRSCCSCRTGPVLQTEPFVLVWVETVRGCRRNPIRSVVLPVSLLIRVFVRSGSVPLHSNMITGVSPHLSICRPDPTRQNRALRSSGAGIQRLIDRSGFPEPEPEPSLKILIRIWSGS